jgi:hypothetical protein
MPIFGLDASDAAILGLWVAVGSAIFTAYAFLITYSRNRKSEQIKIAREIRDDINNKLGTRDDFLFNNKYPDKGSLKEKCKWIIDLLRILNATKAALGYFTFLVKQKEIDDPNILNYYKKANLKNLNDIDNKFEFIECEMKHDTNLEASLRDVFLLMHLLRLPIHFQRLPKSAAHLHMTRKFGNIVQRDVFVTKYLSEKKRTVMLIG